jgi:hypothetical protein
METCAQCAAELGEGDVFCGHCGTSAARPEPAPRDGAIRDRMSYERHVEQLDPLSTPFAAAAARQAVAWGLLAAFATLLLVLVGGLGSGVRTLVTMVWIGTFLVYLFMPIPVSLSEWKALIEGRASLAQGVFGHVAHTLRRRQVPVDSIKVRQLSQPGHPRRDYLQVRHGILTAYMTCFPYGTDLYVGWTLWWRFSPFHYALMLVGRRWQILTGRGTELHLLYRYDVAKAMREAMHAAVGETVDAACELAPLQPLPTDVPVEVVAPPQLVQPTGTPPRAAT